MDVAERNAGAPRLEQVAVTQHPDQLFSFTADDTLSTSNEAELVIRSDERGRIARELHDSTSQLLVVLDLQLMRLKQFSRNTGPQISEILAELGTTVAELHQEVRAVANPEHSAPHALANELRAMALEFGARTGFHIRTIIRNLADRASPNVERALYRVAQEALANALRHSKATNICLSLTSDRHSVTLRVRDDGVGFPPMDVDGAGRGIVNMRARLAEVGGKLTIKNLRPGAMIEARVELAAQAPFPSTDAA